VTVGKNTGKLFLRFGKGFSLDFIRLLARGISTCGAHKPRERLEAEHRSEQQSV
jgi:hypothetical protein